MNNENKSNINVPLVIIGLVLIVALVGGWLLYSKSKTPANKTTTGNVSNQNRAQANRPATPNPINSAPIGAQPPNFLGSQNASVTIEEFADFQCGSCAAQYPVLQEIKSIYGGRIKFIYRHYPLTQIHQKAYDASVASEAAGLQGSNKFWEMQNLLFTNQATWVAASDHRKVFEDYAQRIGLDVERFKSDMYGMGAKSRVDADMQRGRALNVSSTPTIYVNGTMIDFSQANNVPGLRQIIDAELAKTQSTTTTPAQTTSGGGSSSSNTTASTNAKTK